MLEKQVERELRDAPLRLGAEDRVALWTVSQAPMVMVAVPLTLPLPVTPKVATKPSLPPSTPSKTGSTPLLSNTSRCVASSSYTRVKANFSTARLRLSFVGGWIVICVGAASPLSSTRKNRSFEVAEGRSRRCTSNSALVGLWRSILSGIFDAVGS